MTHALTSMLAHGVLGQTDGTFWLPPEASNFAQEMDPLFYFILYLCAFFFVAIMAATGYFMWKYRRRSPDQRTSPVKHHSGLEFLWSVIPTVLLVVIFMWGQDSFVKMATPPGDAMDVRVIGQKWKWTVNYPTFGKSCENKLVVPLNKPVKLTLSSVDVLHSFFIPAFRLKRDAVPNRYTGYWFTATQEGEFDLFCAEYCGQQHSDMIGRVQVMNDFAFKLWVESNDCAGLDPNAPDYGEKLFAQQGCTACHSVDGTKLTGPSLLGKYGATESFADGSTAVIDDNYLRESIVNPNAKIVAGFGAQMPSFAGRLDDQQINALIDYIKSLKADGQ